jgi:hypothetical protein
MRDDMTDYNAGLRDGRTQTLEKVKEKIEKLSITQNHLIPVVIEAGTRFIFTEELLSKLEDGEVSNE